MQACRQRACERASGHTGSRAGTLAVRSKIDLLSGDDDDDEEEGVIHPEEGEIIGSLADSRAAPSLLILRSPSSSRADLSCSYAALAWRDGKGMVVITMMMMMMTQLDYGEPGP